jgi:hypothetical protein
MRLRQTLGSENNKNEWTVNDPCTWLRSFFQLLGIPIQVQNRVLPGITLTWVGQQLLETVVEAGQSQTQRPLRKHGSLKGRVKLQ